ncbi:MAG: hypothetical protein IT379_38465 [Deltaproteobacteria bacterium]|nr:hypothetical protein [Deltaproteobacteria bacterium]
MRMTSMRLRFRKERVAALVLGVVCATAWMLATSPGHAQVTGVTGGDFRRAPIEDTTLLMNGRWELGLNLAGVFVSSSTTPEGGERVSQTTFYGNPGLFVGRMFGDRIQVRLLLSYLRILTQQSVGDAEAIPLQDSHSFLGGLAAIYHYPLPLGFAFYGGLGGLAQFGVTNRPVEMMPGSVFKNSTTGFGGQAFIGLLSQPGPRLTLRAGLRFDALFGSEQPEAEGVDSFSSRNLQLLLEFAISMRF